MKVLILSCDTGEGHNSAGNAIMECVKLHGDQAEMLDIMMLSGKLTSHIVGGGYCSVVKHTPAFFSLLYKLGTAVSSSKRKSPVYYANSLLAKKLKKYIDENGFDIIVAVHLFPAETLTYMKSKGMLKQKVIAVETDYTCIPFWEETNCDYYIIPHKELIDDYVAKGIPANKLRPYGIPVKQDFSKPRMKKNARDACHIPQDANVYLIMSGSMGFGKIQIFVADLLRRSSKNDYIIVICGNNKKLYNILTKEFGRFKNVKVKGYTKHIAAYMDASDVLFTKPGGLTSTEAAVKGIPVVHTKPIPGCETCNLEFFTTKGMSVSSNKFSGQIAAGQNLLNDRSRQDAMRKAQFQTIPKDASFKIYRLLLRHCLNNERTD